jgi:hypothetical protein
MRAGKGGFGQKVMKPPAGRHKLVNFVAPLPNCEWAAAGGTSHTCNLREHGFRSSMKHWARGSAANRTSAPVVPIALQV